MAAIKIPGTIAVDKNENKNTEMLEEIDLKIDPLDNFETVDFDDQNNTTDNVDIDLDQIAGDESGYDSAVVRIEQEEKIVLHKLENQQFEDCLNHRIRIIALSKIIYPEKYWKIGKYQIDLADTYLNHLGTRYANQCLEHAQIGTNIISRFSDESLSETEKEAFLSTLMMGYFLQARCEILLKRFNKSYPHITNGIDVLDRYEKLSSVTDEDVFSWKSKLFQAAGKICMKNQKLAEAEDYIEKVKELIEQHRDRDSVMLIPVLHLIAQIEQTRGSQNSHGKSISYCQEAHDIACKNHDAHSDEVIQTCLALSTAYSLANDNFSEESAKSYLQEAIDSLMVKYGDKNEKLLDAQKQMAKLLIRTDYQAEAIVQLKSNLKLENELYGEYALELLETHRLLGSLLLSAGDMKMAMKNYEEALLIEEIHNGKKTATHSKISQVINKMKMHPMFATSQNNNDKPIFKTIHKPK